MMKGNAWAFPFFFSLYLSVLGLGGDNDFVTLTVDVDNLYCRVLLEMLAELGDVHVHAASIEVIVVDPNRLQRKLAL